MGFGGGEGGGLTDDISNSTLVVIYVFQISCYLCCSVVICVVLCIVCV